MRGSPDASAVLRFTAEQQRMHRLLTAELRQLTSEDEQLRAAVDKLTAAQLELALRLGNETLFRQVTAASGSLPYDAALLFEVVMGNEPWSHRLTQHTFTIANVYGNVRHLTVECAEGRRRIDYEIGVDWTIPRDWTACMLQVHAKKATTFRLYEF
jgi:hypothetical protein